MAAVAIVGALALAGLVLAVLRLEPSTGTDTLVGEGSEAAQATERFRREFGDEAVVVLVEGDLARTVLTSDLGRLIRLEGCLSGNVPEQALRGLPAQCRELAGFKPAKVVYGPGTFVNTAVREISRGFEARRAQTAEEGEQAAESARAVARRRGYSRRRQKQYADEVKRLAQAKFIREALGLALRYGLTSFPSIDNPEFVSQLIFDPRRGPGVPKARFAYLFPSPRAALIQVRMRPNLGESDRDRAIDLIRSAVREKQFRPERGARYVVSGVPVVVDGLAREVERSLFILLAAALVVMSATLAFVFRTRVRLLPLALALAAAAITFGAFAAAGLDLTMASIAALPVLIGLAVDYAIQLHARFDEARAGPRRPESAAVHAAAGGGPTIAGAGLATAAGFLVLLLSPIPMVHGFAVLVIIGVALAFACALTAGLATLARFHTREPAGVPPILARLRARLGAARNRVTRGRVWQSRVLDWPVDLAARVPPALSRAAAAIGRRARAALGFAIARPRNVLVAGLAIAALGWAADTQTEVVSDVRELVPQDTQALRDVNRLQDATGVSGEIDVTVRGDDLTTPAVLRWMTGFQQRVLEKNGYAPGDTCRQPRDPPEVCPAFSLTDIFRTALPTQQNARALLDAVPAYFSQGVISRDRRIANLAFGIRLMPLERQKEVIDSIRSELNPPEGVSAELAGLPVLAAEANSKLASDWRRALLLVVGLIAVFAVLYAIRRSLDGALVPLIPIALATGWSALLLLLLQKPLNPMSATLGALVIAISTEFSVLLSARYREERLAGAGPRRAIELTYASTGAAVLASGATAIAGFATLIVSDIRMLRDFGVVTVVDLTVSLLGVMVVLPAALIWAEQRGPIELRDLDPRRIPGAILRGVRQAPAGLSAAATEIGLPELRRPRVRLPRPRRPRLRLLARRPRLRRKTRA